MQGLARWFHSLQAQLILWAILPMTMVIVALAFTGVYAHEQEMQDFVAERNAVITRLVSSKLADFLSLGWIAPDGEDLSPWLNAQSESMEGALFILNTQGDVISPADPSIELKNVFTNDGVRVILQQRAGSVVVENTPQQTLLVTAAEVPGTEWIVILLEPVETLLGPILRFSNLGPIVAFIAAGLSVMILTFGWRTIVSPLQELVKSAGQVSWGNHKAIDHPVSGVEEIRDLHHALHAMVERIEGYEVGISDYLEAVTDKQEAERAHLARELHDGPVQTLIALGQRVEMVQNHLKRREFDDAAKLVDYLRVAEIKVAEELRCMIGALRPAYLDDLGFLPALEILVRTANAESGAVISLEHDHELPRLCSNVELAVYRIVQEALNNALKHAEAHRISVSIYSYEQGVTLTVADDGKGFTPSSHLDTYTRQGHFGLVGIKERVRHLRGKYHLYARPGEGTVLSVSIPDCQDPNLNPA
jgi:signal transduction histidine kinase